jgi:hypothetical protein
LIFSFKKAIILPIGKGSFSVCSEMKEVMMQQVFATNGQCVPTEPSVGALLEEVAGLAEDVFRSGKECALLGIWYEFLPASRDAAYRWAQGAYGLPEATLEERESPQGLVHFWSRIKDILEEVLSSKASSVVDARPYDPLGHLPCHRGDFTPHEGPYDPGKMYPFKNA